MTSDHRVAGSSPAGCKYLEISDLEKIQQTEKSNTERKTYHSLTIFKVYPRTMNVELSPENAASLAKYAQTDWGKYAFGNTNRSTTWSS
jgi:hypothetical protein